MPIVTIFFILLIAAFAVIFFFTEPSKTDKLIHARLIALDRKTSSASDEEESGIVRQVTFSTIPAFDSFLRQNRIAQGIQVLIVQADLPWTVGRFLFTTLTCVAAGAALGSWWISSSLLGWLPGFALGMAPYFILVQKRNHRFRKFVDQLPEAIDLMSRGLRAGQALPATLDTVSRESEDPLRSEFRRAADEQSFGLPFREAMMNLSQRLPVPDLLFLVTAIVVQKETGGNLAAVLDKTSAVIRERVRVEGQMRIRSAQGRLTGWILCALPFALFFFMNVLNPGYGKALFEEPLGQKMVLAAAVMMVLGVLMIRKIVAFDY